MNALPARHAAVIGIDAYSRGIAPLKSAVADARAVAHALEKDHAYEIAGPLLDADATTARILSLLEDELPRRIRSDSALLLYFAGHGVALDDGRRDITGPEGFLLPQDAHPADESTWLSMDRIRRALGKLPCRHLLVLLDCCFAGSFRWAATRNFVAVGRPLYDSQYQRYLLGTAWQVLTSAAHDEKALDVVPGAHNHRDDGTGKGRKNSHSPFAAALLRGLAGDADSSRGSHEPDGVITATELHQYIFEELVPQGSPSRQTPGLWPLEPENTGEYIFLSPRQERKTRADPPLDDGHNPWRGLAAYGEDDASLFFGRERVAKELAARITSDGAPPLLAVVGASGTGKSSVVKSGLLPLLRGASPAWAAVVAPRLEGDPRERLAEAERELAEVPEGHRKLLVFDQFEELFTQCPDAAARDLFLEQLRELMISAETSEDAPRVVLTLRSDFEPRLKARDRFAAGRYPIPALTVEELREVIEKPAAASALYLDPLDLVDELIEEVTAMPGALPLLSFALTETYRRACLRRRDTGETDRALKRQDFENAGGVVGALHRRADELYDEAVERGHQDSVRRVALRMVSLSGGRVARRRIAAEELCFADPREHETAKAVVERLTDARLVVADAGHVEPAHDTLVQAWPRLTEWLAKAAPIQGVLRALWYDAVAWNEGGRDAGLLWNEDPRLAQAVDLYGEQNALEQDFVDASLRRRRRLRAVRFVVLAVLVFLVARAVFFQVRTRDARAEARLRGLAAQSRLHQGQRPDLALLLALELDRRGQALEARRLLFEAFAASPRLERLLHGHEDVRAVAWSPEGRLASGGADATVRIWKPASQDAPRVLAGPGKVWSLAWTTDGKRLAAGGDDGVYVWELDLSTEPRRLDSVPTGGSTIYAVAWSSDGRTLAAARDDQSVRLLDIETGRAGASLSGATDWVTAVTWSPDGRTVAAAGMDKKVRLWAARTGAPLGAPLVGHAEGVTSLAWSAGDTLASSSLDGTAVLWDVATGTRRGRPLRLPWGGPVAGVAWSPGAERLAMGGADGRIAVWDLNEDPPRARAFTGVSARLRGLAWSADGRTLASGHGDTVVVWNADNTVRLAGERVELGATEVRCLAASRDLLAAEGRDPVSGELTLRLWRRSQEGLTAHGVPVRGLRRRLGALAWNVDGTILAGLERDGTVRRWEVESGQVLGESRLEGQGTQSLRLSSPAWSADGGHLAARRRDGTVGLWDATTGAFLGEVTMGEAVMSLAWSTDGHVLAAAGRDLTVRFWDVDAGRPDGVPLSVPATVTVLAWSHDGRTLATADRDHRIRLWDVEQRAPAGGPLEGHADTISGLVWSPDDTVLLSVDMDGMLRRWDVDSESWKDRARRIADRDLTAGERERFFLDSLDDL